MRTFIVGILGIAVGSSFSMLLTSTNVEKPCTCDCRCGDNTPPKVFQQPITQPRQPSPYGMQQQQLLQQQQQLANSNYNNNFGSQEQNSYMDNFAARIMSTAAATSFHNAPGMISQIFNAPQSSTASTSSGTDSCFIPPPEIDIDVAEAALTKHFVEKWGKPKTGRELLLCYNNNNQKMVSGETYFQIIYYVVVSLSLSLFLSLSLAQSTEQMSLH
jgi:hypothetical protein